MTEPKLGEDFSGIELSVFEKDYHHRDQYFIETLLGHVHKEHYSRSNFYIGSGKKFFYVLRDVLISAGVDEERIISDNH